MLFAAFASTTVSAQGSSGNATGNASMDELAAATEFNYLVEQPATLVRAVYPNPAHSNATIALAQPAANRVDVAVVTYNGTVVSNQSFAGGATLLGLDLSNMPAGNYILLVREAGKTVQSLKLLKGD